jgi:PAS domain S-box-containing protein/diguanylate cyclase (GGDEF)-like protein
MSTDRGTQAASELSGEALLATLDAAPTRQWLNGLLAALPLAAAIADETLCLLAVNPAFCALLERDEPALLGMRADALLGVEAWARDFELRHLPLEPGRSRCAAAYARRLDGTSSDLTVTLAGLKAPSDRTLHLMTLQTHGKAPSAAVEMPDAAGGDLPILCRPLLDTAGHPVPILALQSGLLRGADARRQIERVAAVMRREQRAGVTRTYVVPVPFSIFAEREHSMAFLAACRALPETLRESLMLMLEALPPDLAHAPLAAALEALRPFAGRLALALETPDALPESIADLGIALLALPAERLADGYRSDPERLEALAPRLRAMGIALLSAHCATQADAEFARRLQVDYLCCTAELRELPRSRLFALSGVEGPAGRFPLLPHTAIIEATDSGIVYVDATHPDQPIVRVNPAFLAMTGYAEHEVLGRNCRFLQGADTCHEAVVQIGTAIRRGEPVRCELLNYRKDGSTFWNQLLISPVRDHAGRIIAFTAMLTDVTARHEALAAQDQFAQMLEGIGDALPGFIYQISQRSDGESHFTYLGRSAAALLGLNADEPLTPSGFFTLTLPEDRPRIEQRWREATATLSTLDLEFVIERPDGQRRWLRSRVRPIRRSAGEILWNGVTLDVTPEKLAKDELTYLRDHDPLTRLPNAKKFHGDLAAYLAETRLGGQRATLYMVDFVRFHEINDTYGMSTGDQILTLIAGRLQEAFPAASRFYRLQADQFAVLGNAAHSEECARQIAAAAAPILSAPFSLPGGTINLPARIGLYIDAADADAAREDGTDGALEFAQRADIALHAAKRAARPGISLYSTDIDDRLRTSVIVKQSLRSAIEHQEFELHYQPIVQIATGRILGAEALVRWNHPLLGMQRPDSFIPIAEESGLIGPLGAWILGDALRAAARCHAARQPLPRIAVNVSGVQISDPGFLAIVESALTETGVDPRILELELTETFLIEHSSETAHTLAALRKLGIRIAIDDFGAGYSSFHYLRHLPVDKLKVDRSFIRHLQPAANGDVSILKAMVAMARSLNVELVIEGVETPYQRDVLAGIGCAIAQGYFFSRPVPLPELMRQLERSVVADGTTGTEP